MEALVIAPSELGLIDTYFIALDATPIKANATDNNPK